MQTKSDDEEPETRDRHRRLYKRAQPKQAWARYAAASGFKVGTPTKTVGAYTLDVAIAKLRKAKGGKFDLTPTPGGVKFKWKTPHDYDHAWRPELAITLKGPQGTWTITTVKVPVIAFDCGGHRPVRGEIAFHPSPDGKRVAIVMRSKHHTGDCVGAPDQARFRIRGLGPQIRIFHNGSPDRARALAARLEARGWPVADITKTSKRIPKARIGHRSAVGASLAPKIAAALGAGWAVEPLKRKKGRWEQIEVYVPRPK